MYVYLTDVPISNTLLGAHPDVFACIVTYLLSEVIALYC